MYFEWFFRGVTKVGFSAARWRLVLLVVVFDERHIEVDESDVFGLLNRHQQLEVLLQTNARRLSLCTKFETETEHSFFSRLRLRLRTLVS